MWRKCEQGEPYLTTASSPDKDKALSARPSNSPEPPLLALLLVVHALTGEADGASDLSSR